MKHNQKAFWHAWINLIIENTSEAEIKEHIRKHTEELKLVHSEKEKEEWIASMKNLLYIYEGVEEKDVNVTHMLARLNEKFLSNPVVYDAPPKAELKYKNKQLIVPSSFELERGYSLKKALVELIGGSSNNSKERKKLENKSSKSNIRKTSGGLS